MRCWNDPEHTTDWNRDGSAPAIGPGIEQHRATLFKHTTSHIHSTCVIGPQAERLTVDPCHVRSVLFKPSTMDS